MGRVIDGGYHPLGTWKRQLGTRCCAVKPFMGVYTCSQDLFFKAGGCPCGPACEDWVDPGNLVFLPSADCMFQWVDALQALPKEEGRYLAVLLDYGSGVFLEYYSPVGKNISGHVIPEAHGRPCFYTGGLRCDRVDSVRYWMPIPPVPGGGAAHE